MWGYNPTYIKSTCSFCGDEMIDDEPSGPSHLKSCVENTWINRIAIKLGIRERVRPFPIKSKEIEC